MDLDDTRRAFDAVAPDYDGPRGNNALIQRMRARLHEAVARHAPPRARLLDLGCGTGLDVAHFAREGHDVTGIDLSPAMVERTRARIAQEGLQDRARAEVCGIEEVARVLAGRTLDAAYSNLGPLNCVPDFTGLSRALAEHLAPGGVLVASVIGRVCPWEIAWYLKERRPGRVRARFRRGPVAVPLADETVWTRYFTPREFARGFSRDFDVDSVRALHVLLPPPYLVDVAEKHPRLVESLERVEARVAGWPLLRSAGDSFLIVLRKR